MASEMEEVQKVMQDKASDYAALKAASIEVKLIAQTLSTTAEPEGAQGLSPQAFQIAESLLQLAELKTEMEQFAMEEAARKAAPNHLGITLEPPYLGTTLEPAWNHSFQPERGPGRRCVAPSPSASAWWRGCVNRIPRSRRMRRNWSGSSSTSRQPSEACDPDHTAST